MLRQGPRPSAPQGTQGCCAPGSPGRLTGRRPTLTRGCAFKVVQQEEEPEDSTGPRSQRSQEAPEKEYSS